MAKRPENGATRHFKDPAGVAVRMLRGASRESVWPLIHAGMALLAKPLDTLAASWECRGTDSVGDCPQILIVGSPRSGSTLLSQILASTLCVSYFPNVSALFPSAPIWSTRKWMRDFDVVPRAVNNFYGQTVGLRGINDGFHIWNRWLGSHRYHVDDRPGELECLDMRAFFGTWSATFSKPLLNKNNRNVDAMEVLAGALPRSYFVIVERDLVMIVQSLLRARTFIQGSESAGWGLFADEASQGDPIESACRQVTRIQTRIDQQLFRIPPDRCLKVQYEHFSQAPATAIDQVLTLVPGLTARSASSAFDIPLRPATRNSVTDTRQQHIADVLARNGLLR